MKHTKGYQAVLKKTGKFTFILPQLTLNVVLLYFLYKNTYKFISLDFIDIFVILLSNVQNTVDMYRTLYINSYNFINFNSIPVYVIIL